MFSQKRDRKLIRLVQENTMLYDPNHPKYVDNNEREVTWQKIGDVLKRPGYYCKERWINIRDTHRRKVRENLTHPVNPPRKYKYDKELEFIKPYYRDVVLLTMDLDADDDVDDDKSIDEWNEIIAEEDTGLVYSDGSDVPVNIIKKKKTKNKQETSCKEEDDQSISNLNEMQSSQTSELDPTDPVDAFLLSIGATLKTFSPYHLNVAKSKIFAIVQEHDLQQIVQQKGKHNQSDGTVTTTGSLFLQ